MNPTAPSKPAFTLHKPLTLGDVPGLIFFALLVYGFGWLVNAVYKDLRHEYQKAHPHYTASQLAEAAEMVADQEAAKVDIAVAKGRAELVQGLPASLVEIEVKTAAQSAQLWRDQANRDCRAVPAADRGPICRQHVGT